MSEKDKMLAGELYDANYNKELIEDWYKAKDICFEYNNLRPSDSEGKDKIIKIICKNRKANNSWTKFGVWLWL